MAAPVIAVVVAVLVGAGVGSGLVVATMGSSSVAKQLVWQSSFSGGPFDDGIHHAATIVGPVIPSRTSMAYLTVSLSVTSWTRWNGMGNSTGTCDSPGSPTGACNVYIGIWTAAAWNAYTAGGPLQPFWCYSVSASACANVSAASFTSPSLVPLEGQAWEVVIWNIQLYGLIGNFELKFYASPYFSPGT